jgi:hypothetical protein
MAGDYRSVSQEARRHIKERHGEQFTDCDRVHGYAVGLFEDWETRGGRGIMSTADGLLVALLARSADTFACSVRLCRLGYGAQSAMLNRSLFEDMADAHWIVAHPETAAARFQDHHDHGRMLLAETVASFPQFYPDVELPEIDPAERERLDKAFGTFGQRPWSGLNLHQRVQVIKGQWPTDEDHERLRFMHALAHRENNQTLHVSAQSLGAIMEHDDDGGLSYYRLGPRADMIRRALWGAYWTFTQTVGLVIDRFAIPISDHERAQLLMYDNFLMADEPHDGDLASG